MGVKRMEQEELSAPLKRRSSSSLLVPSSRTKEGRGGSCVLGEEKAWGSLTMDPHWWGDTARSSGELLGSLLVCEPTAAVRLGCSC